MKKANLTLAEKYAKNRVFTADKLKHIDAIRKDKTLNEIAELTGFTKKQLQGLFNRQGWIAKRDPRPPSNPAPCALPALSDKAAIKRLAKFNKRFKIKYRGRRSKRVSVQGPNWQTHA